MNKAAFLKKVVLATTLFLMVFALYSFAQIPETKKHPVEVEEAVCSQCHPDKWPEFDHTRDWYGKHRFSAGRAEQVCGVCHEGSFCADCHAVQEEIKPSDKYKQSPDRALPHRGDYLSQHMVDGKINPAPCFRCHGRRNNARCKVCHK